MDTRSQKLIEGIGFSENEAGVYLACLESDGGSNTRIAKKSGLNRITNYEILKRLIARGVVAEVKGVNVKRFSSVEPKTLLRMAKEKVAAVESALPVLMALSKTDKSKPRIFFYEGIEGIKSIYEDSLNSATEILTFTNPSDVRSLLGDEYVNRYVRERTRRKISVRGLAPDTALGAKEKIVGANLLRDTRLFPAADYPIGNEIMIYDDKIAVFSGIDKIGLIIQNKSLTDSFRSIWKMAWLRENWKPL